MIVLVFVASSAYAISVDHKLRERPVLFVLVFAVLWLWQAALVVGGYMWSWVLFLLTNVAGLIQTPWDWHGLIPFVLNVLLFVLLLAPETRSYVGLGKHPAPPVNTA
jgi:hypothetical protein